MDEGKTKYPNFLELFKYYPCGVPAVCEHAGIKPELLKAVLETGEMLEPGEVWGIACLYHCNASLILHNKTAMLDMRKTRHRAMAAEVDGLYIRLRQMWEEGENEKAGEYYRLYSWVHQRFMKAAYNNRLSYGHYLGAKERFWQLIRWSEPPLKKRGLP